MPRPISQSVARFFARSHRVPVVQESVLADDAGRLADHPEFAHQRCCHAKITTDFSARMLGNSRDVGSHEARQSNAKDDERFRDDGDAEHVRQLVDTGHGSRPAHSPVPMTEMDRALGAFAPHRDAASCNADTYVIALCVLAFASLALLGVYPFYTARQGDVATSIRPALTCSSESHDPSPNSDGAIRPTCR